MIRAILCVALSVVLTVGMGGEATAHWGRHRAGASWGSYGGAAYAQAPAYSPAAVWQAAPLTMPAYQAASYQYVTPPSGLQSVPLYYSSPYAVQTYSYGMESTTDLGGALEAAVDDRLAKLLLGKGAKVVKDIVDDDGEEPADDDCSDLKSEIEKLKDSVEELKMLVQGNGMAASPIYKKLAQLRADHDKYFDNPDIQAEFAEQHDELVGRLLQEQQRRARLEMLGTPEPSKKKQ